MSFAVAAGLHRDAEIVNLRYGSLSNRKVSIFDQEMRRRLWSTIAELELQSALDRGMPASLPDLIIDCGSPSNCEDEELDQSMEQKPKVLPISQYTRSSFQHIMSATWHLRQQLVSLLNGSKPRLNYEDMLHYDRIITRSLDDDIPRWDTPDATYPRCLIQVQLQQLLSLLHRPYVDCGPRSSRFTYSNTVQLDAAKAIVEVHHKVILGVSPVLNLFRQDVFGAALGICYNFANTRPTIGECEDPYHLA